MRWGILNSSMGSGLMMGHGSEIEARTPQPFTLILRLLVGVTLGSVTVSTPLR
jgi:hypothetical protein